jgi:hypothetical protein
MHRFALEQTERVPSRYEEQAAAANARRAVAGARA